MGNPKGSNAGTVGVKGKSGRKSAYEEEARAKMLVSAWFDKGVNLKDFEKLKNKMKKKKGKILLWDLFKFRATTRKGTGLTAMFNKLFPNKHIFDATPEAKEVDKRLDKLLDIANKLDNK